MFQHPSTVPLIRALAVYSVMHNIANVEVWEELGDWVREDGIEAVLDSIIEILRMNGSGDLDKERAWWRKHLCKSSLN